MATAASVEITWIEGFSEDRLYVSFDLYSTYKRELTIPLVAILPGRELHHLPSPTMS